MHHIGDASTTLATSSAMSGVQEYVVLSAHLLTGHSLLRGHVAVLATEDLLLLDHACGTVYLLICDR